MTTKENAGRIALVTGCATGIGAASVRALHGLGMFVIGTDVDDARGEQTMQALGERQRYLRLDVRDSDAWQRTLQQVVREQGKLDLVHLNAGVMTRPKGKQLLDDPLDWLTKDGLQKVMSVNLNGVMYGIIAALETKQVSQIIVTASGAALLPLAMDPYYTASKFAVLGLGLSLDEPLRRRGVRIDVICPGAIDTEMTAPDIRAAVKQEPPSFVGAAIAELATTLKRGPIWMAFTASQGLQRYEPPGLPGMSAALDVTEKV